MKKLILFIFVSIGVLTHGQQLCPVLPTPKVYKTIQGNFVFNSSIRIQHDGLPQHLIDYLADQLQRFHGIKVTESDKAAQGISFINVDDHHDEGYAMNIDQSVVITYTTEESSFHAIVTLLQMIQDQSGQKTLHKCFIMDSPRMEWRGLHLDVSRHFFTVDEVKEFIDQMAYYKFNTFHWHLTDDQGWRIEIKKYPKLTTVGAFRDSTVVGHYSDTPRSYSQERYGGFYTQEEIREVVEYAAERYVNVVPEIEMPGHSRAALAAYPELSCTGDLQPVPGLWGVFDDIYCAKPASIEFMKNVLTEVLELFPSEYIHIGGDEAPKTRWKACTDCQQVIANNQLTDEHELQSYFIGQIDDFLTSHKRKLIGWDEILEGGLSPNAAVMSWRGESGGIEAAKQHHEVVMSPTSHCYFDYYQSSHPNEPLAIGGYLPLEKVYNYELIPDDLTEEERSYILGGQANVWTEYMPDMDHVMYMVYPRALALMQNLWCEEKPAYADFLSVYLESHEATLLRRGVNVSKSIHYPNMCIDRGVKGLRVHFEGVRPETEFHCTYRVLNPTVQVEKSASLLRSDTLFIGRPRGTQPMEHQWLVRTDALNEPTTFSIKTHRLLGAPVELITPANEKYNHNGSLNLVDGIMGGTPWKGSEWLGFQLPEIKLIVDLEVETVLESIRLGLLDSPGSWIYLPESVRVETSMDGEDWEIAGELDDVVGHIAEGRLTVSCPEKARYLRLTITTKHEIPAGLNGAGHVPWTFIDEIEITEQR